MSQRFFHPEKIQPGKSFSLAESESHHLIHVMRAQAGDSIVLFDGTGSEFSTLIESVNRKTVDVLILAENKINRELSTELIISCPIPKSDRQKFLLEKLTELGVTHWIPMITHRSNPQTHAKSLEKLKRLVIEASKQCGRNRLMSIGKPTPFSEIVINEAYRNESSPLRCWIADPTSTQEQATHSLKTDNAAGSIFLIGPEGGFTPEEILAASQAGWQSIRLGKTNLRMETAAMACATLAALT